MKKARPVPVMEGVEAVPVEIALVIYRDEYNRKVTQFALIGKYTVHMLDGRAIGTSSSTQRSGPTAKPLRDAIFRSLGREIPEDLPPAESVVARELERA